MEDERELARLLKLRSTYKGLITKVENWLNAGTSYDEFDIDSKLEMMETYYKPITVVQEAVKRERMVKQRSEKVLIRRCVNSEHA